MVGGFVYVIHDTEGHFAKLIQSPYSDSQLVRGTTRECEHIAAMPVALNVNNICGIAEIIDEPQGSA